ncbi:hypothetical protein [Streptomyces sp. NPDC047315]|uniref:hypothetical protein n=1 Tax=Streptomyces sp. NPDC047315 TaxID=3155142 RepID=UPI0034037A44
MQATTARWTPVPLFRWLDGIRQEDPDHLDSAEPERAGGFRSFAHPGTGQPLGRDHDVPS